MRGASNGLPPGLDPIFGDGGEEGDDGGEGGTDGGGSLEARTASAGGGAALSAPSGVAVKVESSERFEVSAALAGAHFLPTCSGACAVRSGQRPRLEARLLARSWTGRRSRGLWPEAHAVVAPRGSRNSSAGAL